MTKFEFPDQVDSEALANAQDLVYDAWEAQSKQAQTKLAKKALQISPFCADAYTLLGDKCNTPEAAIQYYLQAVEAGEKALGINFYTEFKESFWSLLETRPYMRARASLAEVYWTLGNNDESIKIFTELLELNPNDHQGLRYILASHLLATNKYQELHALLIQYEDDIDATWAYSRVLLEFLEHGKTATLSKYCTKALESNRHIPKLLIEPNTIPKRIPESFSTGGMDQAIIYAKANVDLWHKSTGVIEWLKAQMDTYVVPLQAADSESESLIQDIQAGLEGKNLHNREEFEKITNLVTYKKNQAINDDFLGFSPSDMHNLLYYPFESEDVVIFNRPKKAECNFLFLYQKLSDYLVGQGAKATTKGNLPLKICKDIYAQYNNPFQFLDMNIRTETDFGDLHVVRLIAEIAGLIKKQKGVFTLTKKGIKLQSENAAGELFHTLFKTFVGKFNWGYSDGYPECRIIQMSALFQLYALQIEGSQWHETSHYEALFLRAYPSSVADFEESPYSSTKEKAARAFYVRAIQRFWFHFGFIEIQEIDKVPQLVYGKAYKIRKTTLVDDYLSFKK